MAFNDPISELLTKIRNAKMAKHLFVDLNLSSIKLSIVKILLDQGFIKKFLVDEKRKKIRVFLKYTQDRQSIINNLLRISKPGLRKYVSYKEIPSVRGGLGIAIISTSKGVLDDKKARELKVGGELMCYVW